MRAIINRGFGSEVKVRLARPCVSSAPHLRGLEPRHDGSSAREEIVRDITMLTSVICERDSRTRAYLPSSMKVHGV